MPPPSDRSDASSLKTALHRLRWTLFTLAVGALLAVLSGGDPLLVGLGALAITIVALATHEPRLPAATPDPEQKGMVLDPVALVDALIEPALLLDRSGRVVAVGQEGRALLPNAKNGVPLSFLMRDPTVLRALDEVRQTGRDQIVALQRPVRHRTFEVHLNLLHPLKATPVVLVQFKDITQVQQIARMRTDFIANASHEMRTPLASILGFIETLQGAAKNDAAARERFLGIMAEQARRMARLIDDLLSLSRLEERAHLRPTDTVDVRQLVSHAVDGLQPLADEQSMTLTADLPSGPVEVRGDGDELTRVYVNLIENAIKYGRSEGSEAVNRVDVRMAIDHADVVVTVRDHGPGIPAEHLPRLTERFYRVDTAHSRETGGTGLGLSLVRNTLSRHRGALDIASTEGEGATFTARLPRL